MAINQAKKNVLIFSTAYLPLVGGAEIAVKEITQRLSDWQFDMITAKIQPGLVKFEKIGNINIYRVGFGIGLDKFLLPFLGLLRAKKLERENHYDLAWSVMASFGGFLGLLFKKKYPKKPWLLTLQEGDPPEDILKKVGMFRKWFYQIFQKADYFQAISIFLYDWAIEMGARSGEVVPNGVDLEEFRVKDEITAMMPTVMSRSLLSNELDIEQSDKVILTVSRLVRKNGVDDLIKAGRYLKFPFKIIIIGSGPDEEKLKKIAKDIGLKNKVIFKGKIEYGELPRYYALADVFVRPSLSEGLGNVFLEAMACGTPIIGTPVGGIPDFLEDGKTGLFCRVGNPQDIAEKIKEILENKPLRKTLAKNGLKLVQEKYNWDNIAFKMEGIFKKIS